MRYIIFFFILSMIFVLHAEENMSKHENRLSNENSPYLLQHANNPVNWYPWSDEAFKKAAKEDKPIFLSIGYSTCHWCHVMEKESFEDTEVAALLNSNFICIKVDREERPEIDSIYMKICQIFTGSGGWPLTILMTPDKEPFYADTYIPKKNRYGKMGLLELIPRISILWNSQRDKIKKSTKQIIEILKKSNIKSNGIKPDSKILDFANTAFNLNFDKRYGGFGSKPKFPTPHNLLFLLRYWKRTGSKEALEMVTKTLTAMREGGIWDHVGKGFHRYSTDMIWLVPHFEKMLYDQAMLAIAYSEAYQVSKNQLFSKTVKEILEYVNNNLKNSEGGYFSAQDADSKGIEGLFYLWRLEELKKILSKKELELLKKISDIRKEGNFNPGHEDEIRGTNIIHYSKNLSYVSNQTKISEKGIEKQFDEILEKLNKIRKKRIHPFTDDKILTDWNGLMIVAFATAARIFDNDSYLNNAKEAARFILSKMREKDGSLLHTYRKGNASITANLEDYAFFIWGSLEIYDAGQEVEFFDIAVKMTDMMIEKFLDKKHAGFFMTAKDSERQIIRPKVLNDNAVPSGNSVALLVLAKLYHLTGNKKYEKLADDLCKLFNGMRPELVAGNAMYLTSLDFFIGPTYDLVIAGKNESSKSTDYKKFSENFHPNLSIIVRNDKNSEKLNTLAPYTKLMNQKNGKYYLCIDSTCELPENDITKIMDKIGIK